VGAVMNMSQQRALVTSKVCVVLGYLRTMDMARRSEGAVIPPLGAGVLQKVALGIMYLVWGCPSSRGM